MAQAHGNASRSLWLRNPGKYATFVTLHISLPRCRLSFLERKLDQSRNIGKAIGFIRRRIKSLASLQSMPVPRTAGPVSASTAPELIV